MPNIGTFDASVNLDLRKPEAQWKRFQSQINRNFGKTNPFATMAGGARDFDKAIGSATNRVVAFGAAAVVFNTLSNSVTAFVAAMTEVDKSLTEINVNLNQSGEGLKKFGADLFNIARQTGQTFQTAAQAATELARQGLTAEETLKRLKDALILSRTTGMSAADSVETLTAAINSFNKEALTSTEVVNKFAAVDTKFAVSSRDLAEAVSRVGSTAQAAGVGINELVGLVTSLQQTTARGGATIGNGLKTIFTRIQAAPETVSALESVGVAIKDSSGNLRGAIDILRDYGRARERVGEAERQALDRTVAGTFQINILKAALSDLSKGYSVYDRALQTSANATDEAIRKNEQLNQSLSSLFNSAAVSAKQLVDAVGNQGIGPLLGTILKGIEQARQYLSGDSGSKIGEALGDGILQGLTNVITGPVMLGLVALIGGTLKRVLVTFKEEAKTLFQANSAASARAKIQERINQLYRAGTVAEQAELNAVTSIVRQKEILLGIQARLNREMLIGTQLQNSFLTPRSPLRGGGFRPSPQLSPGGYVGNFADPLKSAISREVAAGVPPSSIYIDKDPRVATSGNPMGLLVANRRDEPLGGFQGVNRVIAQGGNPRTAGRVPNFALTGRDLPFVPRKTITELNKILQIAEAQTNLGGFYSELSKATDIALGGKLGKGATENLFKEIGRLTDERLKLEKQIEVGRFKGAKRAKEFAEQEVRLADLRAKLQKSTEKVLAKQAQRAAGLNAYSSPIGPRNPFTNVSVITAGSQVASPGSLLPGLTEGNVAAAQILASRNGGRLVERGGMAAAQDYNAQLARRNPIPRELDFVKPSIPSMVGDDLISRAIDYDVNIAPGVSRQAAQKRLAKMRQERAARLKKEEAAALQKAQRAERNQNRAFFGSFALPLAAGFVDPAFQALNVSTTGGTAGGIASGALKGAGQGAALGVFGPIAGAVGAAGGALIGVFSKITKSGEELAAELGKARDLERAGIDQLATYTQLQEQLNDALASGDMALARNISSQRDTLLRDKNVTPETRNLIASAGGDTNKLRQLINSRQDTFQSNVISDDLAKAVKEFRDLPSAILSPFKSETEELARAIANQAQSRGINLMETRGNSVAELTDLFDRLGAKEAVKDNDIANRSLVKALDMAKEKFIEITRSTEPLNRRLKEFEFGLAIASKQAKRANVSDALSFIRQGGASQRSLIRAESSIGLLGGYATQEQQIGLRGRLEEFQAIIAGSDERRGLEQGLRETLRNKYAQGGLDADQRSMLFDPNTSTQSLVDFGRLNKTHGLDELLREYEAALAKNIEATEQNVKTVKEKTEWEKKAADVLRRQTAFSEGSTRSGSAEAAGLGVLKFQTFGNRRKKVDQDEALVNFFERSRSLGGNTTDLQGLYNTAFARTNQQKGLAELETAILGISERPRNLRNPDGSINERAVRYAATEYSRYRDPTKSGIGKYVLRNLDEQAQNVRDAQSGTMRVQDALSKDLSIKPEELIQKQVDAATKLQETIAAFNDKSTQFVMDLNVNLTGLSEGLSSLTTEQVKNQITLALTPVINEVMAMKGKPMPPSSAPSYMKLPPASALGTNF